MRVIWARQAQEEFFNNLDYWEKNNGVPNYSDKIEEETKLFIKQVSDPECVYFGRYSENLQIYIRPILKGRFQIYFSINEEKQLIEIIHFKNSKQNF